MLVLPQFWKRGFKKGLTVFCRRKDWCGLSFLHLTGILFLVQFFVIALVGVQGVTLFLLSRTEVHLEVHERASDQGIREFYAAIFALPYVEDVSYVTREQAYEREREDDPDLISFLEEFGLENPFPEMFSIHLRAFEYRPTLRAFLEQSRWQGVIHPLFLSEASGQERHIYALVTLMKALGWVFTVALFVCLFVLLLFLVEMTVRESISDPGTVLVPSTFGADKQQILVPLVTYFTLLLLLSLVASVLLLVLVSMVISFFLPSLGDSEVILRFLNVTLPILRSIIPLVILIEIILSPVVAWFTTAYAVRLTTDGKQ